MLRNRWLFLLVLFLGLTLSVEGATKRFTLCIDAGHGGHDSGAQGKISKEKTLTLRYALAFGRIVEQNCPDVKVIYTRKTDRFIELWQRAEIANKAKADLFVSVHINSLPRGHIVRGYQTYTLGRSRRDGNKRGYIENLEVAKRENAVILYEKDYQEHYEGFDPNSPESNILFELVQDKNLENSIQLAKFMQKNICSATGRQDKGVYQDNLAVLRLTSMPACLMELGFISTPDEEQYLNTDRAVQQFTRGFYNAFVAYKNKVAPGIRVPYKPIEALPPEPQPVEKPVTTAENAQAAPRDNQAAPRDDQVAPRETEVAPRETEAAPRETQAAPRETQVAPRETQVAPRETQVAPREVKQPVKAELSAPVFKVQILTSDRQLKKGDSRLKGLTDATYYKEGGLYKYTVGASADYQTIYKLRKEVTAKFPEAFIVAFRGDKKTDVQQAIQEYRKKKQK